MRPAVGNSHGGKPDAYNSFSDDDAHNTHLLRSPHSLDYPNLDADDSETANLSFFSALTEEEEGATTHC